jgi:beta-1,4-mannosyltransferase
MTQLTVHARPAHHSTNPYTALLAKALERQGALVREVGMSWRDLPNDSGVLLLHWPDEFYRCQPNLKALLGVWVRLLRIGVAKWLKGLVVVWVAHDVKPHAHAPDAPPLRWKCFLRLVDGVITLSRDSMDEQMAAHPDLLGKPRLVTAHGHFFDLATAPPQLPQGIGDRSVRLAALGTIRAYKNTASLARSVAACSDDITLTIRGALDPPELGAELTAIAANCPHIALDFAHLSDQELEAATDEADLIVLPYADMLNSGVLFFALSRFRPVLAPRRGSMPEVRRQVGEDWVHLFDGDFGPEALEGGLRWLRQTTRHAPPDLSGQDWNTIAADIMAFLRALSEGRTASRQRASAN